VRALEASRRSVSARSLVLAALAFAPACSTTSQSPAHAASPGGAPAATPANGERELAGARDKVAIANLQLALSDKRSESSRLRKEKELELSRAELTQFEESDMPNQLAKSKLELTRRRDSLTEQQEELAQLEMLYEKQDLADKTREIVLQRGKRRVERAQDDLAISERESATLESKTLPRQRAKLAFEIEAKTRELDEQKSEAQVTQLEKRMAVRTAEAELKAAEAKAGTTVASGTATKAP
jgi:hypothetical protein